MENFRDCTGTNKKTGEELAYYRLLKPSRTTFFAIRMNSEQLSERRIFLRKVLAPYPKWENLSNEELEDIRLYHVNAGYIVEDEKGYQFLLPARGVSTGEREFRKIRAMIPFEFMDITGNDFQWDRYHEDITKAKVMLNQYILNYGKFRQNGMGLYIYSGTKGSGKTMLACCLLNEIAKRYLGSIKFVNVLDFLEMTKRSYDGIDDVKSIYTAGLLVLDDIGVQMSKEWVDTVLYRLVNERYTNRLPTIYTSNVPVNNLKMDDRIIDRIDSTTYCLTLPEESVRKEIREQTKQQLLDEIKSAPSGVTSTGQSK